MIRRNVKPKRESTHMQLVKEADAWTKAIVLNRQNGECLRANWIPKAVIHCGGPLQGAHILRKGGLYANMRYDLQNVVVLCRNHHMFWSHLYEHDFYEWIEEIYPGRIAMLKASAQHHRKQDLRELICVLKSIYQKELDS